jgi:peptidyl-prolyl cis-trans isomerase C
VRPDCLSWGSCATEKEVGLDLTEEKENSKMLGKKTAFLCLMAWLCVLPSCKSETSLSPGSSPAKDAAKKEGPVLAKVGGEIITVDDFESELSSLPEYTQKRMNTMEQKKKHLEKMIDERLLLLEAGKRKLDQDEEIQKKVDRYRNRLITEKLYREIATERSAVGAEEIQAYYQEHKDRFQQKERIRVSQILILSPPNASAEKQAEAKKKAQEALNRVRAGEDFATVAKEYSEGPAASRGGDLGFFSRGRMVPEFEEIAFSLKEVGDKSDLVRTKFGFHIIELTGRQPAQELALEDVKDRIVRQLESARRREVRQSLADELREQAKVEIQEGYFEEAEAPSKE